MKMFIRSKWLLAALAMAALEAPADALPRGCVPADWRPQCLDHCSAVVKSSPSFQAAVKGSAEAVEYLGIIRQNCINSCAAQNGLRSDGNGGFMRCAGR